MRRYIVFTLAVLIVLSLVGCGGKKDKAKNMQQIQADQGIPVRVRIMGTETYVQQLRYNASLAGSEESTAQAMIGDVVTQIHAKVGDRVSKGQVVISFPINTPAAQYEQASTAFAAQRQAYERMQRLFEKGAVSRQDLDNLETGYKVSKANLEASEQMIKVRAPISGIITAIHVNLAEKVYPGKDLFTVTATGGYKAVMMVPDTEVSRIKKGAQVSATVNGETINGRISQVAMALDPQSRAVRVEAVFPGVNKNISYGSNAQINVTVLSKPNCMVVNREHIGFENGAAWVWVNENNRAVRREIQTGLSDQLHFEVITGLNDGDQLITEGNSLLSENALIRLIDQGE